MHVEHLLEFLCAAHVAQQVEGPWEDKGGIALVAPPGQLKTSILGALANYPNARLLSDVNVVELANLRGDMVAGRYKTLAFLDYQKCYERNQGTAANIEGSLRAITAEGWQGLAHEAQVISMPGRAFVILCLTPSMYKKRGLEWNESGFSRRFLWLQYTLSNPELRTEAMHKWEKLPMGDVRIPWPISKLPMRMTKEEAEMIEAAIATQPGTDHSIQFQLLARIYQTLKWHYKERRGANKQTPLHILQGAASLLHEKGGEVLLTRGPQLVKPRSKSMAVQTA